MPNQDTTTHQKSSFGRNLLGKFIELDEPTVTTGPAAVAQPSATPAAQPATYTPTYAVVDPDMLATLQKAVTDRKTAYTALIEAASKLSAFIPDENTRFKAAFAQISGDGQRTSQSVSDAIDIHINDINGELMRFKKSSDQAIATKVGSLRASVSNIVSSNTERNKTIVNLQSQIASIQQNIATDTATATDLTKQADAAEADIAAVATKFQAAADSVKQELVNKKSQLASTLTA